MFVTGRVTTTDELHVEATLPAYVSSLPGSNVEYTVYSRFLQTINLYITKGYNSYAVHVVKMKQ